MGRPIIFVDKRSKENRHLFTRQFKGGLTLTYCDGDEVAKTQEARNQKFIEELKPQGAPNHKVITMDLETREINGSLQPTCISIYMNPEVQREQVKGDTKVCKSFGR